MSQISFNRCSKQHHENLFIGKKPKGPKPNPRTTREEYYRVTLKGERLSISMTSQPFIVPYEKILRRLIAASYP